jgi:hypothetical protein
MNDTTLAWHFVGETLRDGSPIPTDGELLSIDGDLAICKRGLHAAEKILDALTYAPGNTICRVSCSAIAERHNDKFVCAHRTILWRIDGEPILRDFARRCALDAAGAAAGAAARDAAGAAAWAAAWDAAWDATGAAAWAKYNDWLTEMVEAAHNSK